MYLNILICKNSQAVLIKIKVNSNPKDKFASVHVEQISLSVKYKFFS